MARRAKTSSRVDFGMGSRGDVPARRVGTLCLSPGVPTPDPDPFGHRRGFGGLPPNGRLGRPLCRLPAKTTCRGGPLKGPPLNKELYETVGGSGRRVGTCVAGHPTPFLHIVGVVWRGAAPPSRRSRAGKEEVPPPMTRSNLDRWEDCGEAPQGTSLAQLRSNVLDFSRLKSDARRFWHGTHSEVQGSIGRAHARPL